MSEQEKSGHNATEESSMVMVEKEQTDSTLKTPFRPTELEDEQPGQPHIRSKAPAVPLIEELKNEPNASPAPPTQEAKSERKEGEKKSSERPKRSSKKSKHGAPEIPETITLTTIEVEPLKEKLALPSQPIPVDVISITSAVSEPIPKAVGKLLNEEELAALAPKTPNRISEWQAEDVGLTEEEIASKVTNTKIINDSHLCVAQDEDVDMLEHENGIEVTYTTTGKEASLRMETSSRHLNKKEVSWNDPEYLDKVHLKALTTESQNLSLERKASVGPCFRPGMPYAGPSGITICLPRKSIKNLMEVKPINSGISLSISKKSLSSKSKFRINNEHDVTEEKPKEEGIDQLHAPTFCLSGLKQKLDAVCVKIRNGFI